ncbi:MAG: thiol-disulfide isomerase/thioredoxin [Gammaproteobacteria bacterium]
MFELMIGKTGTDPGAHRSAFLTGALRSCDGNTDQTMSPLSKVTLSRRTLIQYALASAAGAGIARQVSAAPPGIGGRMAPALHVPYWIDGDAKPMAKPTVFEQQNLEKPWVVLKFFQSWCPGCHSHGFPTLQNIADAFGSHPQVQLLAVQTAFEGFSTNTQDRLQEMQEMQERDDLRIPFGHDSGDPQGDHRPRTMRDYRSGGTPWLAVVSLQRQGCLQSLQPECARLY